MSPEFSSVLISHADADDKLANAFRAEAALAVELSTGGTWDIEQSAIIAQEPLENWSLRLARNTVRHALLNLENELNLMKSLDQKGWLWRLLGSIYTNLVAAIPTQSNIRATQLERILTAKHMAAWRKAALSNRAVTLVIESDAKQINSAPKLAAIIDFLNEVHTPAIVSLSTPFSDEELGIKRGSVDRHLGLQEILPPRSNTTCCYLLNSSAAQILVRFSSNSNLEIRADWLINKASNVSNLTSYFTEFEIVQNSSLASKSSSIRVGTNHSKQKRQ